MRKKAFYTDTAPSFKNSIQFKQAAVFLLLKSQLFKAKDKGLYTFFINQAC